MANETPRNYEGSDSYMVQTSLTLHALLTNDLADFTDFDPEFDATFLENWHDAIEAADAIVRDQVVQDIIEGQTATVIQTMTLCRKKYKEVKYFAEKAFAGNKPVLDEFGTEDYTKSRNRQGKLIELMGILHKAAEKYKVALIAKQYSQPRIDAIKTLRDSLQDANTDQDVAKKGRPMLTKERIDVLNAAYKFVSQVCDAAQLIYEDEQTKRDQYVYGAGSSTILDTKQGTVAAGMKVNLGVLPASSTKVRMKTLDGGPLEYGLSADGLNFNGNTVTLGLNGETMALITDFNSTGTTFVVFNQNAGAPGEYKVEFIG